MAPVVSLKVHRIISKNAADCKRAHLTFYRYLTRKLAISVLVILVAGLFILASSRLLQTMQQVLEGKLEATAALLVVALRLPELFALLLPLAWVFSVYLIVSLLWSCQEIVAAQFSGISQGRITRLLLLLCIPVALLTLICSAWLVPLAHQEADRILFESRARSALVLLDTHQFHDIGNGWQLNLSEREQRQIGRHLWLRTAADDGVEMIWAPKLEVANCDAASDCTLHLTWPDGLQYASFAADGRARQSGSLGQLSTPLLESLPGVKKRSRLRTARADVAVSAHRQWHLAMPLFCFIAMLMVLPLAGVAPRQSRFRLLPLVLPLVLVYMAILLAVRQSVGQGSLAPFPGTWGVHLLFIGLIFLVSRLPLQLPGGAR